MKIQVLSFGPGVHILEVHRPGRALSRRSSDSSLRQQYSSRNITLYREVFDGLCRPVRLISSSAAAFKFKEHSDSDCGGQYHYQGMTGRAGRPCPSRGSLVRIIT